jgi:hypothetical protein
MFDPRAYALALRPDLNEVMSPRVTREQLGDAEAMFAKELIGVERAATLVLVRKDYLRTPFVLHCYGAARILSGDISNAGTNPKAAGIP